MIYYHGTPITPDTAAVQALTGRHALVSFAHPAQIELVSNVCSSFCLDNGAFSAWRGGKPLDVNGYYKFVDDWIQHPGFDFALIPDVIDGTEEENDRQIALWPFLWDGVPVWHLHESFERLSRLLKEGWPRIALGSSGEWSVPGNARWWARITKAMDVLCGGDGHQPLVKIHGLRMADHGIVERIPFSSVDSCNIARNIGIDLAWSGTYTPPSKAARAEVLAQRIESINGPGRWFTSGDLPLIATTRERER